MFLPIQVKPLIFVTAHTVMRAGCCLQLQTRELERITPGVLVMLDSPFVVLEPSAYDPECVLACLAEKFSLEILPARLICRELYDTWEKDFERAGLCLLVEPATLGFSIRLTSLQLKKVLAEAVLAQPPETLANLQGSGILDRSPVLPLDEQVDAVGKLCQRQIRANILGKHGKLICVLLLNTPVSKRGKQGLAEASIELHEIKGYARQLGLVTDALQACLIGSSGSANGHEEPAKRALFLDHFLTGALLDYRETMKSALPGIMRDKDSEHLHKLRVAARKSRSILRTFESSLPPNMVRRGNRLCRAIGRQTNRLRDFDVLIENLESYVDGAARDEAYLLKPLLAHLLRKRMEIWSTTIDFLGGEKFARKLRAWQSCLKHHGGQKVGRDNEGQRLLKERISDLACANFSSLQEDIEKIGFSSSPEALHDLRKKSKQFRYILELYEGQFGGLRKAIKGLKQFQESLGEYHDLVVHTELMQGLLNEKGSLPDVEEKAWDVLAELMMRLSSRRIQAKNDFLKGDMGLFNKNFREDVFSLLSGGKSV